MLSNIGRAAIRRVGAGASQSSTNRIFQSAWYLQRVNNSKNVDNASVLPQLSFSVRRSYATAAKATQTTRGRPKGSTSKTTTRKASPRKAAKKPVKKKAVKKVARKPKRKPVKKVVLTEAQKGKVEVKKLKITALTPPKGLPKTAWTILLQEMIPKGTNASIATLSKEAAAKYKTLTAEELESYNHRANQNKAANETAYKKWVEAHTPDQIRLANNARTQLKKKSSSHRYPPIVDSRIPTRPRNSLALFTQERWASGDLQGIKTSEAAKLLGKEWQALSASERKPFEDRVAADKRRYAQEFKTVFHRDPKYLVEAKAA